MTVERDFVTMSPFVNVRFGLVAVEFEFKFAQGTFKHKHQPKMDC